MWTGICVASATRWSRPASRAPPPARTIPWSMMSATSSGGVSSIVSLIVSMICWTDGSIASRIWSAPTSTLRGSPVRRSRPRRLADRQAGADRGGHRLLDETGPAGAGVEGRIADGPLLDLRHPRRDPKEHPRPRDQPDPIVDLVDEVLDHLLGDVEVADDAVAERPDGDDARRRPPDHPLRLRPYREDDLRLGVDRYDRGLTHDDPAIADMDKRVGRPEIDPDIAGEQAEEAVEHVAGRSFVRLDRVRWVRCGSTVPGHRWIARSGQAGKARAVYPPIAAAPGDHHDARLVTWRTSAGPALRPVERDAAVAQRDPGVMADDEVVEQIDVEQAACSEGLGRQVEVVRRRRRVARRVVVDEDEPGRVEPDGVPEELPDADERGRHVALVDGSHPKHDVLRVQEDDPQLLALEAAHLEDKPIRDVGRGPDRPAAGRPVGEEATAELERRRQLGRPSGADPGQPIELHIRRPSETRQPVVAGQRVLGEIDRRSTARPGSPEQPDQLGGAEAGRATSREPLARPLCRRDLADRPAHMRRGPIALEVGLFGHRPSPVRRRSGSSRARTTEARRFLPPSGPGNTLYSSATSSPTAHRRLHRGCTVISREASHSWPAGRPRGEPR